MRKAESPSLKRSHRAAFQPKVRLGVFEADAANQAAQKPLIVRDLAAFHFHAH